MTILPYAMNAMRRPSRPLKIMGVKGSWRHSDRATARGHLGGAARHTPFVSRSGVRDLSSHRARTVAGAGLGSSPHSDKDVQVLLQAHPIIGSEASYRKVIDSSNER